MARILWVSALLSVPFSEAFTLSRPQPFLRMALASGAENAASSPEAASPEAASPEAASPEAASTASPAAALPARPPSPSSEKDDLLASVASGAAMVSPNKRVMVSELLLRLEAANPTAAPATSPLVNGEWELVYSGGYSEGLVKSPTRQLALFLYAGGYAPTAFGLNVARLLPDELLEVTRTQLTISRSQPRVTALAEVKALGNRLDPITITSTLETESDVRIKETYTAVAVGGRTVEVPEALQYSRVLFVTYLDDDLMVVRDATGVSEVLLRKEKKFLADSGEPSSADDDLAPGAG